jgi:uncharacterized protein YqcC (DUF446 family)
MMKKANPNLSVGRRKANREPPSVGEIAQRLAAVVEALKRAGFWELSRPPESAFENMGAFGMNTMAFAAWLRWVFVPTIEARIASCGPWPTSSSVAAQAVREFDGDTDPGVLDLRSALSDFDTLFGPAE